MKNIQNKMTNSNKRITQKNNFNIYTIKYHYAYMEITTDKTYPIKARVQATPNRNPVRDK